MPKYAQVGDFCPTETCLDYGKLQSEQPKKNIKKFGKTQAGRQRYQCKTCGGTFTETKGRFSIGGAQPRAKLSTFWRW